MITLCKKILYEEVGLRYYISKLKSCPDWTTLDELELVHRVPFTIFLIPHFPILGPAVSGINPEIFSKLFKQNYLKQRQDEVVNDMLKKKNLTIKMLVDLKVNYSFGHFVEIRDREGDYNFLLFQLLMPLCDDEILNEANKQFFGYSDFKFTDDESLASRAYDIIENLTLTDRFQRFTGFEFLVEKSEFCNVLLGKSSTKVCLRVTTIAQYWEIVKAVFDSDGWQFPENRNGGRYSVIMKIFYFDSPKFYDNNLNIIPALRRRADYERNYN